MSEAKQIQNHSQESSMYAVFINAKSYDFKLLDIAMQTIYKCICEGGIVCNPPRPKPTKKVKFTIRRAPSIYKSSFEKFEYRLHSRILVIESLDSLDKFNCLTKADIPRAVNIDIKIFTKQELSEMKARKALIAQKLASKN